MSLDLRGNNNKPDSGIPDFLYLKQIDIVSMQGRAQLHSRKRNNYKYSLDYTDLVYFSYVF